MTLDLQKLAQNAVVKLFEQYPGVEDNWLFHAVTKIAWCEDVGCYFVTFDNHRREPFPNAEMIVAVVAYFNDKNKVLPESDALTGFVESIRKNPELDRGAKIIDCSNIRGKGAPIATHSPTNNEITLWTTDAVQRVAIYPGHMRIHFSGDGVLFYPSYEHLERVLNYIKTMGRKIADCAVLPALLQSKPPFPVSGDDAPFIVSAKPSSRSVGLSRDIILKPAGLLAAPNTIIDQGPALKVGKTRVGLVINHEQVSRDFAELSRQFDQDVALHSSIKTVAPSKTNMVEHFIERGDLTIDKDGQIEIGKTSTQHILDSIADVLGVPRGFFTQEPKMGSSAEDVIADMPIQDFGLCAIQDAEKRHTIPDTVTVQRAASERSMTFSDAPFKIVRDYLHTCTFLGPYANTVVDFACELLAFRLGYTISQEKNVDPDTALDNLKRELNDFGQHHPNAHGLRVARATNLFYKDVVLPALTIRSDFGIVSVAYEPDLTALDWEKRYADLRIRHGR